MTVSSAISQGCSDLGVGRGFDFFARTPFPRLIFWASLFEANKLFRPLAGISSALAHFSLPVFLLLSLSLPNR
jgi:hypothetical protein